LGIVVEDEILLKELADIICWCIGGGIHHVTTYDMKGILKSKEKEMQQIVTEKSISFFGQHDSDGRKHNSSIYLHSLPKSRVKLGVIDNTMVSSGNNNYDGNTHHYDNNEGSGNCYNVYIASAIDGRGEIAQMAQRVCQSRYNGCHDSIIVDQVFVNSNLKGFPVFTPEPDLVLNFDSTVVMSGFIPWHIRLTEFLRMGALQDFTLQQFIHSLYDYSKTERRHGI